MEQAAGDEGQKTGNSSPLSASAAYDGASSCIGAARHLAVGFLGEVQAVHGLPVSERAMGMTQLVVSELVTNAVKYAPGPVMLDLQISDGAVRVSVWDSDPALPDVAATDPQRVGRHGLEITLAVKPGLRGTPRTGRQTRHRGDRAGRRPRRRHRRPHHPLTPPHRARLLKPCPAGRQPTRPREVEHWGAGGNVQRCFHATDQWDLSLASLPPR